MSHILHDNPKINYLLNGNESLIFFKQKFFGVKYNSGMNQHWWNYLLDTSQMPSAWLMCNSFVYIISIPKTPAS